MFGAVRGSFAFLAVTNVYFRPTLSLTHLKPMEETRDSKKMLLKIEIDEEKRENCVLVRVSCMRLHLGRSTRKRMLLLPGDRGSGK